MKPGEVAIFQKLVPVLQPPRSWNAAACRPNVTALCAGPYSLCKSVLIPGCGRGYDNATFVKAGAKEAVGLEVAPAAKAAAEEYLKASLSADEAARAPIMLGDFFSFAPDFRFDVGYDYTFFCAVQPQSREELASSWARLIKPAGQLVTIIFPVNSKQPDLGPPFPVTPELYKDTFTPAGFILKKLDAIPPSKSHPGRAWRTKVRKHGRLGWNGVDGNLRASVNTIIFDASVHFELYRVLFINLFCESDKANKEAELIDNDFFDLALLLSFGRKSCLFHKTEACTTPTGLSPADAFFQFERGD
ncbi:S-adenosyl-L-methionine-dependent methyltransferase [Dunaliella salina]|uniref:S-adenosyl-L-methionine-dependent methyltransferase n=1 Tax=Dunaliella salina TaxID=3046 RepID=A0ABQ7G953_DUNSA|nr:S-adenosyl-L-methionine-dependent methyltransferase [Dunaliella salina]|eukprot:KAF5831136.1 S-adenosyl-L-methionine-dependent methyltransferase [Dunaliella salina]